jgi:glucose/arabinose dehydrogenase
MTNAVRLVFVFVMTAGAAVWAQQGGAGRGGGTQAPAPAPGAGRGAPIGVPREPFGNGPWVLDTAEQHKIRVSVVTKGLVNPWSLLFLPDGSLLVTERPGRIRIVRNGVLDPLPISGVPKVHAVRLSGLMDVALHPRFEENRWLYFTYSKPREDGMVATVLGRGRLDVAAHSLTVAHHVRARRHDLHDDRIVGG